MGVTVQRKIKEIRGIGNGILNMVARKCFTENQPIYTSVETDRNPVMCIYGRKLQRKTTAEVLKADYSWSMRKAEWLI